MLVKVARFLRSKKIIVLLSILALTLAFFIFGSKNITSQVKSEVTTFGDDREKQILDNVEKYQPKYDWFNKNKENIGLTADSAIVIDQNTGQIIYAKNEHSKLPPASITKVLTLITVLENMDPEDYCIVSKEASETQPNKLIMAPGEKLKVKDLLYSMTMISANDSAEVLAECYKGGREEFIKKMNERVALLGLSDSDFKDPNGLNDENQFSSAFDMATITRYALLKKPESLSYLGRKEDYSIPESQDNKPHYWYQVSQLLKTFPGMEGAKTGYTHVAKNTYVGIAQRNGRRIIIVYFGARTTTNDATILLDYGLSNDPKL